MAEWQPKYAEAEVRDAVENASTLSEAITRLGLRAVGGNFNTIKRLIAHYGISTDHMDANWTCRTNYSHDRRPLAEIMVEHSTYNRGKLKRRLYDEGLKTRRCELCGQGELWFGRRMSLIIDHVNGVGDDNRLENLRIVCPNCAATLETHCGRQSKILLEPRTCLHCGEGFMPRYATHRYCTQRCGVRATRGHSPRPQTRRVTRPPYAQLVAELDDSNWEVVARRYGVSSNAVRKWMRWYRADERRSSTPPPDAEVS